MQKQGLEQNDQNREPRAQYARAKRESTQSKQKNLESKGIKNRPKPQNPHTSLALLAANVKHFQITEQK